MYEIGLIGLDGGNLLGYMAALGTLRALTLAEPEAAVRMRWVDKGYWTPVVHHSRIGRAEELVEALASKVCGASSINPAWEIGDDLKLPRADFGRHLSNAALAATAAKRDVADFLAAFGSEIFGDPADKELIADTEFRTMSGASNQHFLAFMREFANGTEARQLSRALLELWDYGDGRPSMRWDPADFRTHALRIEDPSTQKLDPIRTMRGANRLAIEALPLFPTVPQDRLRTVAFQDREWLAWPIWIEVLSLEVVASLLTSEEVQNAERSTMTGRGIEQVFRARRFTKGKVRNFSPARALL